MEPNNNRANETSVSWIQARMNVLRESIPDSIKARFNTYIERVVNWLKGRSNVLIESVTEKLDSIIRATVSLLAGGILGFIGAQEYDDKGLNFLIVGEGIKHKDKIISIQYMDIDTNLKNKKFFETPFISHYEIIPNETIGIDLTDLINTEETTDVDKSKKNGTNRPTVKD